MKDEVSKYYVTCDGRLCITFSNLPNRPELLLSASDSSFVISTFVVVGVINETRFSLAPKG